MSSSEVTSGTLLSGFAVALSGIVSFSSPIQTLQSATRIAHAAVSAAGGSFSTASSARSSSTDKALRSRLRMTFSHDSGRCARSGAEHTGTRVVRGAVLLENGLDPSSPGSHVLARSVHLHEVRHDAVSFWGLAGSASFHE